MAPRADRPKLLGQGTISPTGSRSLPLSCRHKRAPLPRGLAYTPPTGPDCSICPNHHPPPRSPSPRPSTGERLPSDDRLGAGGTRSQHTSRSSRRYGLNSPFSIWVNPCPHHLIGSGNQSEQLTKPLSGVLTAWFIWSTVLCISNPASSTAREGKLDTFAGQAFCRYRGLISRLSTECTLVLHQRLVSILLGDSSIYAARRPDRSPPVCGGLTLRTARGKTTPTE